jgi:hypothetical protein
LNKRRTLIMLSLAFPTRAIKHRAEIQGRTEPKLMPVARKWEDARADVAPETLLTRGFHELLGAAPGDECACLGVALSMSRQACSMSDKSLCVCMLASEEQERGQLHGHGLTALGIAVERTVVVTAVREKELLWTLEEALTSGAFGAVVGALGKEERLYAFSQRAIASIMRLTASRCRMSSPASARNARSAKPATACSAMPSAI